MDDMYSGLAEAYGVATVLFMFLQQYMLIYPVIISKLGWIHMYCDNQGVVDRINMLGVRLYPRDAIQDDYHIYSEIQCIFNQLHPLQLKFHHVKGQQDRKPN